MPRYVPSLQLNNARMYFKLKKQTQGSQQLDNFRKQLPVFDLPQLWLYLKNIHLPKQVAKKTEPCCPQRTPLSPWCSEGCPIRHRWEWHCLLALPCLLWIVWCDRHRHRSEGTRRHGDDCKAHRFRSRTGAPICTLRGLSRSHRRFHPGEILTWKVGRDLFLGMYGCVRFFVTLLSRNSRFVRRVLCCSLFCFWWRISAQTEYILSFVVLGWIKAVFENNW